MHHTASSVDPDFDELGYAFNMTTARDAPSVREAALWCAVIEQACCDVGLAKPVTSKVPRPCKGLDFDAAKRFLLRDMKDFFLVCSLAGVNPSVVRAGAARIER